MKKTIIQSNAANEIISGLRNKGCSKTLKTLTKALKRVELKSARRIRRHRTGGIKTPIVHRQFNGVMLEAVRPILTKSVAAGELDVLECAKIESQINTSINNPFFQLDPKYLSFIVGKLKAGKRKRQGLAGGLS